MSSSARTIIVIWKVINSYNSQEMERPIHVSGGNRSMSTALAEAHMNNLLELLPVIVAMCVLGIIGILGNTVTIRFYWFQKRTPTVFLIKSLAAVDLIVCVLSASNIAEMIVNVKYMSGIACKLMHCLGHWFVESSGLILGFIALDRYWTICGKMKKRVSETVARRVVIGVITFSGIMSVRDFVNFDVIEVNIHNASSTLPIVIGHYCSNSDEPSLKLSVLIFHGIDAMTFLAILVVILFTYSNVIWTLCKVKKIGEDRSQLTRLKTLNKSTTSLKIKTIADNMKKADLEKGEMTMYSKGVPRQGVIEEDMETGTSVVSSTLRKKKRLPWKRGIGRSELNVTMLMLAVSAAFFLCAAPYFAIRIGLNSVKRNSDLELDLAMQFGLRLCYINSVLNPLIYCLFNPSFRRHMKKIMSCNMEPVEEPHSETLRSTDWSNV